MPGRQWVLRCNRTGAAWPNGERNGCLIVGQHFPRFETPTKAFAYAKRLRIPVEAPAP